MSSCLAPSFKRGCISDFAKTPQREAIGYIVLCFFESSFNPVASVFIRTAIWSMKAPVPPAQDPFMRCSRFPVRYVILASSPPSSITTSVEGMNFSIAFVDAATSCTNGISRYFDTSMAPEPVMHILIMLSFSVWDEFLIISLTVFLMSE
ncbi:hypothetical protein DSECCO2_557100 [anaerobic digester metagenome]